MTVPSAADISVELARYNRIANETGADLQHCQKLVDRLITSHADTPADALAIVSWLAAFLPAVIDQMEDDEMSAAGPKSLASVCALLAWRAQDALVACTGLPPETFTGSPKLTN